MLFISCSHIYYLKIIETVILNAPLQCVHLCMCAGGYSGVYEFPGKVELAGFATALGFLLVSKHLAEVGHHARRHTCACTHAHTYTIVCFIGAHRCHGNPISSARGKMLCAKKMPW